jgi:hypothetical protein
MSSGSEDADSSGTSVTYAVSAPVSVVPGVGQIENVCADVDCAHTRGAPVAAGRASSSRSRATYGSTTPSYLSQTMRSTRAPLGAPMS